MRNNLSIFCYRCLRILFIIITLAIVFSRLFIGVRSSIYDLTSRDLVIFRFFNIYVLLFLLFIIYVGRKLKESHIKSLYLDIFHFLISFLVGILALKIFGYTPQYDSGNCVKIANLILENNFNANINLEYLEIYPFQIGYSSIILLFQLVNSDIYISLLQLFQILIYSIANVLLFRLSRVYLNSKTFIYEFIISLFWLVPYLIAPYVYGISLGLSFTIFSLFNFVRWLNNKKMYNFCLSMVFLLIACICKPNFILLGVTYLLYFFFFYKDTYKKHLGYILIVFITLFLALNNSFLIARIFYNTNLDEGAPQSSYLVMGNMDSSVLSNDTNTDNYMKYVAPGHHNGYDYFSYVNSNGNQELMSTQNKENLMEELSLFVNNPDRALKFYGLKFAAIWDSVDFYILLHVVSPNDLSDNLNLIDSFDSGSLNTIYTLIINCGVMSIMCGALVFALKQKKIAGIPNHLVYLIIIYFFGGFFYHMLFEAKSIYLIPYITLLIPLAIKGFEYISDFNFNYSSNRINLYASIFFGICLLFMYLYNRSNLFLDISKELYYDNSINIPLNNNYLKYSFTVDKDSNAIEFYTEGTLGDNILNISLYDEMDNVYYYLITQDQLQDSGYQYLDLQGLILRKDTTYTIVFNLDNKQGSSSFTIPFGPSSYASKDDKIILNGEEYLYSTINFKTYSYFHSNMFTYDHNYNQSLSELYYFGG